MWRRIPRRDASGSPCRDVSCQRESSELRNDVQHATVPVPQSWLDEISRRLATVESSLPRRPGTPAGGNTSDAGLQHMHQNLLMNAMASHANQYGNNINPTVTTATGAATTVQYFNLAQPYFTRATSGTSLASSASSSRDASPVFTGAPPRSVYEEQCRLFGYKPSVSGVLGKRSAFGKYNLGKGPKRNKATPLRQLWRKEVACLRHTSTTRVPDTEEKMLMAKLGLGCKELTFDLEGDEAYLHAYLLAEFPVLEKTGGYSLFRPNTNSYDLIMIQAPQGGITIRYLKDIVRSARLYIRPLQCSITAESDEEEDEELEPFHHVKVNLSGIAIPHKACYIAK